MELVKRSDMFTVPFSRLKLDDGNARVDLGDIDQLKESIRQNGVKEPLWGYKQKGDDGEEYYYIINGSRRYAALRLLFEETGATIFVPFRTQDKKLCTPEQNVLDRLLRNEGKEYTPYEKSLEINKLINYGWGTKEVAKKLGVSENHIKSLLSLANAPKLVQNLVADGTVSATLAMHTVAKGKEAVDELVHKANEAPKEAPQQANLLDDGAKPIKEKKPRVTAKDLSPEVNSWKEFKNFAKDANESNMSATALALFKFMLKILNNETTNKDFNTFFFRSND